jgi:predicted PurR-regulated permease PerM
MNAQVTEPVLRRAPTERRRAVVDRAENVGDVAPASRSANAAPPSQTRVVLQILLIVVGVACGLWALHRLASVLLVLTLAALFAYVIAPLVQLAERPIYLSGRSRRLPRGSAIALVYLLMSGIVAGGVAFVLPSAIAQADDMIARTPAYTQSILAWEHGWSRYYEHLRMPVELRRSIDQSTLALGEGAVESIRGSFVALLSAFSYFPWLVLIPILAFFLLKDATTFRRTLVKALPYHGQLRGHRLLEDLNATIAAYVRAQILACLLVGVLCGLGFAILGVPYPVLLGVLAGALEFIPLVGPLLLATIAATVAALHAPMLALWAVAFLGVLRLLEDYVIYPRLIRRDIELHPFAIILGVLAGADLAGVVGMFLAVPTVAIGSVAYRHWSDWRSIDARIDNAVVVDAAPSVADRGADLP